MSDDEDVNEGPYANYNPNARENDLMFNGHRFYWTKKGYFKENFSEKPIWISKDSPDFKDKWGNNVKPDNGSKRPSFFDSPYELWHWIKEIDFDDRDYYETIRSGRQKIYFDIDIEEHSAHKSRTETLANGLMKDLVRSIHVIMSRLGVTSFSSRNLIILSSCGEKGLYYKFSWHIIIAGFVVANNRENKAFYKLVMDELNGNYKPYHKVYVDDNVYKSTQELRMVGNHKKGSDRALKLCNGYYLDMKRIEGDISRKSSGGV